MLDVMDLRGRWDWRWPCGGGAEPVSRTVCAAVALLDMVCPTPVRWTLTSVDSALRTDHRADLQDKDARRGLLPVEPLPRNASLACMHMINCQLTNIKERIRRSCVPEAKGFRS